MLPVILNRPVEPAVGSRYLNDPVMRENVTQFPVCDLRRPNGVISRVAPTDGDLVARIGQGEIDAFDVLVARYRPRSLRFATHFLGTREDAEEAVQDAFVRAFRGLSRADPDRFGAYLFRILLNRCRTVATRRRWWRRLAGPIEDGSEIGVPHPAGAVATRDEIDQALARLKPEYREAFLLKHVDDMSYDEIQQVTGKSIPALKMRVSRACESLRRILERE